jgi:hypothetical protein
MHNQQTSPQGGHNEHYEQLIKQIEADYPSVTSPEEQRQVEQLLDLGFDWEEAMKLLDMREFLYENDEMHERVANDSRMHFVRWLYENGEISED